MRIFAVLLLLVALAEGRVLQQAHSKIDALNAQVAGLAAHDAIAEAVANGGQGTAAATHKSIHYAKLANTDAAEFEFDDAGAKRHLLQTGASYQRSDKIQMAAMAAQEAIGKAVAAGGRTTGAATKKGMDYARMVNTGSVQPYMFDDAGVKRHLLQSSASYQRSDKIQMAAMAAQEAIGKAVAAGGRTTGAATKKGMDYAQMVNTGSVQPYMFGDAGVKRHLLQSSASYQRSDKIQMAAMAAQEAIGKAVASAGRTTGAATKKGMDYAQMVNTGSVQPYMFGDAGAKR